VNLTRADPGVFVAGRRDIGGLDIAPDGTLIAFEGRPPGAVASQRSS
jgi:hypothetical protein